VLTKPGTGSSSSAEAAYRGENEKIDVECSILFRAGLLCAAACQDLFLFSCEINAHVAVAVAC